MELFQEIQGMGDRLDEIFRFFFFSHWWYPVQHRDVCCYIELNNDFSKTIRIALV
jgi:hypothetical protein